MFGPAFVAIALVMVALVGCVHEPPPPVALPAPVAASSEELRWAIEAGLAAHNWTVTERAPGAITASVYSRSSGDQATIKILYRPGAIEIRCLNLDVSADRYDRWMRLLTGEIQKGTSMLGMGMRRAPLPAPAASPPPPPPEQ